MDNVLHLSSTGSTNEDAYQLALDGAPNGYAVIADEQTNGKGRLGRLWVAPANTCLCCSLIIRPNLPFVEFPKLTLTSGLALCKVVEKITGLNTFGLKWPNDLYCAGKKCGGILVESSSPVASDVESFIIVGIGLNVNSLLDDFPAELQETVTSLLVQTAKQYSIQNLLESLRDSLLSHVQIHEENGFGAILKEWRKRDALLGMEMQWLTVENTIVTGTNLGPDDNGQLQVQDKKGTRHRILSGDVRLRKEKTDDQY